TSLAAHRLIGCLAQATVFKHQFAFQFGLALFKIIAFLVIDHGQRLFVFGDRFRVRPVNVLAHLPSLNSEAMLSNVFEVVGIALEDRGLPLEFALGLLVYIKNISGFGAFLLLQHAGGGLVKALASLRTGLEAAAFFLFVALGEDLREAVNQSLSQRLVILFKGLGEFFGGHVLISVVSVVCKAKGLENFL